MFSVRDSVTAGINILRAIDALENAIARTSANADYVVLTSHEKELISIGIVDARFVASRDGQEIPRIFSLLALRIASSFELPRAKALAALPEFRAIEARIEADPDPAIPLSCAA